jgi:glycosyltransferase involved in cell wall biosynthesis
MKVAIVHDWLTNMGGAERVVLALHEAYPDAPIYTSVFSPEKMPLYKGLDVRTTYLQHLPEKLREHHQLFSLFRTRAFQKLDLSEYDIVISSASAEAKAVHTRPDAIHICYCHTPTRYYWSHYKAYKKDPGFGALDVIIKPLIPPLVHFMRRTDLQTVSSVDYFIANSHAVQNRIKQYYKRDSVVIPPPVDVTRLRPIKAVQKEDFYLIVGRQIPYKRIDLAIKACNKIQRRLIVIGEGSEHERLVKLAGPTVELLTGIDDQAIVSYFQKAKGFLWPQQEDAGVTVIEAMAAGTPVIAYKKDGALDSVVEGKTGVFFEKQTVNSLCNAITTFESTSFSSSSIMKHAEKFSTKHFIMAIHAFVKDAEAGAKY